MLNGLSNTNATTRLDEGAIAYAASMPDVMKAAREARMRPRAYVRKMLAESGGGMAGLGLTFNDVLGYYKQYQEAKAAGQPAPAAPAPVIVQAPPPPPAPWYSNMMILVPAVAGLGVIAALLLKKKRR